jgi:tRNA(fMet)-specific endonuclease VapC
MKSGIMSAERILIDTSVWIEYFRNQPGGLSETVDDILKRSKVCVPRIILAELIQGAKSYKEIAVIGQFMEAFTIIDQRDTTWLNAGRLSYELKKKGKNVHLADCYIAVLARENGCAILTLDRHFKDIQQHAGIQRIDPESKRHRK